MDPETGDVTYSVSCDDYDGAESILASLQNYNVVDSINAESGVVSVTEVTPSAEITADVNVIVDADEVTMPLQQAENLVDVRLPSEYNAEAEGIHFPIRITNSVLL